MWTLNILYEWHGSADELSANFRGGAIFVFIEQCLRMSFLSRVGHFLTGSQDSLEQQQEEDETALDEFEEKFLEQTCNTLSTASLIEDRRIAATSLISFTKLHRMVIDTFLCKFL